jgi:threonine dehydratase
VTNAGPQGVGLPTFADIESAAAQIAGVAHRTPVATSRTIDERTSARVFFKCENLQRAGAFKFRGAYNALSRLTADERRRGVLAYSSGNHAQAVALAGQILGIPRLIVMPADAPAVKRSAAEGYGAAIVLYDRAKDDREAIGRRIAAERGLTIIPPYDHPHIVAGAGTAARELIEETGALDLLLVPCGGGGLLSGSALTGKAMAPGCRVVGVEPAAADDATRSFRTRTLHRVDNPVTIADGARTPSLGAITFPLVLAHASAMTVVNDEMLLRAMFYVWERLKLVVEPTGALAAAALLETTVAEGATRVGVILSGGNVDLAEVGGWIRRR